MIPLNRENEPDILATNRAAWAAEYLNWRANPVGQEPRKYAHSDIRSALEAETYAKCAYCEALSKHVAYTHIEHKLPKKNHPKLVCAWENLTIACQICNTNKGDYDEPECQLLDPHVDDVEMELTFAGPLAFPHGGARADATITRLKLNRAELLFARAEVLKGLYSSLDDVERIASQPAARHALWLHIDDMTAASGEFASACRQFLKVQMEERGLASP